MKYFIDTEFLEGPQRHRKTFLEALLATKKYTDPTIDLISIGIVAEDGREYYAISKDFNLKEAWNRWQQRTGEGDRNNVEPRYYWVRENVLKPIFYDWYFAEDINGNIDESGGNIQQNVNVEFTYSNMKNLISKYGKSNKQIAKDILDFTGQYQDTGGTTDLKPEFYGYYSDYDWVVFCWLFGKMIDLPNGFPMYCIDLKQTLDEKADKYVNNNLKEPIVSSDWHSNYCINELKAHKNYPKQINEHNALADARWNKQLYEFLNTL